MILAGGGNDVVNQLPPGFYFSPTDEELVLHFLSSKQLSSLSLPCHYYANIIPDLLHVSLPDPWDLHGKAFSSGNQHYYFFTKEKENNKVTENGYWKETGVSEGIVTSVGEKVGSKKYLVFHHYGTETSWVMQQYHQSGSNSKWVLCKVYERKKKLMMNRCDDCEQGDEGENYYLLYSDDNEDDSDGTELSWEDQVFLSLDDYDDLDQISLHPSA